MHLQGAFSFQLVIYCLAVAVVRADSDDDIIKKYGIDMSDWALIPDTESGVKCTDDHAGWSGDCAMIDDDWIKNTDLPGVDEQQRPIICYNTCCVIGHHKDGDPEIHVNEMAQFGNDANLHCNGPNEQTWIRGTDENWKSSKGGTFKMCMINKASGNKC
ncbi:hypothetical protein FA10DRAFT_172986 [Acaromyces ingoldii]|uniref:Uncharacterized protein n=1 Tax=Acaromyces ingoldii TaxID=215250 RepID=A0A316YHA1_9BASI|nr:hypothetical protein FA10DRAFT_172986 [Acaromyces ingoldii]PWN88807.1 hypothetical protein FA10DRAFT_172986 [Acaromyces ingoldii]